MPVATQKTTSDSYEVTSGNLFIPKTSDRNTWKRREVKDDLSEQKKVSSGLDKCCIVFLYILLVLCILIGVVGIVLCIVYFNTSSSTQGWKIGGIILGVIICIVGIILILIIIFKQKHKRPWRYKKEKDFFYNSDYRKNRGKDNRLNIKSFEDNDNQMNTENLDGNGVRNNMIIDQNSSENRYNGSQSVIIQPTTDGKTRQVVLIPRSKSVIEPSRLKNGNDFSKQIHQTSRPDLISFTTDEDERAKRNRRTFTAIDRPVNKSNSFNTQNNVTANSKPDMTKSVVVRRVSMPSTKVLVRQLATKVVIVKVPSVAGQLIVQPKTERIDK